MRKIALLGACSVLFSVASATSQQPIANTTWQQVLHVPGRGEIRDIAAAGNGDVVVTGFIPGTREAASDAWVARYSPDGRQLWSQRLGGDYRDEALDLTIAADHSIVIAGWRDIRLTQAIRAHSGFVAKYSPQGELLWDATLSYPGRRISLSQVVVLPDGAVLVAGRDTLENVAGTRALLAKVSATGELLWEINPGGAFAANSNAETGVLTAARPDGSRSIFASARIEKVRADRTVAVRILFGGMYEAIAATCAIVGLDKGEPADGVCDSRSSLQAPYSSGDPPAYTGGTKGGLSRGDPLIQKLDSAGAIVWTRTLASKATDGINAVAHTPDGGVIGAGFLIAGDKVEMHNWDGLIVKLDGAGNEVWRRIFGGSRRDEFTGIVAAPDGAVFVAGYTGSQVAEEWAPWLLRLNAQGELEGLARDELGRRQR